MDLNVARLLSKKKPKTNPSVKGLLLSEGSRSNFIHFFKINKRLKKPEIGTQAFVFTNFRGINEQTKSTTTI